MARPRKQESEKRTRQIPPVRVTEAEAIYLEDMASLAGMTLSEYMRHCALAAGKPLKTKTSQPLIRMLARAIAELNRIGNNLNQIARQLNRGRNYDPDFLQGTVSELRDVVETMARRL